MAWKVLHLQIGVKGRRNNQCHAKDCRVILLGDIPFRREHVALQRGGPATMSVSGYTELLSTRALRTTASRCSLKGRGE